MKLFQIAIISLIISHLLVSLIAWLVFFNNFNLAAPFLFIHDAIRPVTSFIRFRESQPIIFIYSPHFAISYILSIAIPILLAWPSNIIFAKKGQGGDKTDYFTSTTKDFFNNIALYLINKNGYTTITQIKDFISQSDNLENSFKLIAEELKEKIALRQGLIQISKEAQIDQKIDNHLLGGINKILQIIDAQDQFSGVIGSFNTILSFYGDFDIENIIDIDESTITASDLRKENISLYLKIKSSDIKRLNPLITLFLETLTSDIIANEPKEDDKQITFILDEFGNLGKVSKLIEATTISRSYKLNQFFILQDLEQLSSIYGKEEQNILISNTAIKIILKQKLSVN